jgi:hypothetical protein
MIAVRLRVLVAILFCVPIHLCVASSARQYELNPIPDGKDLTRGNKKVLVSAPKGWQRRGLYDYTVGFGLASDSGNPADPAIGVEVNHRGRYNTKRLTPRNSYMGETLESQIRELKHVESFDAGANGKLRIWRFRTYNRNYLLTLIVQPDNEGRTEVDVYVSSDDPKRLVRYLTSLKEVARSIRIVDR